MTPILLVRHGATAWSEARRLQGRSDPRLSRRGHAQVRAWRPPAPFARDDARWLTSPLRRARETAALLGHVDAAVEPRLAERAWGAWEGATLAGLRAADPEGFAAREALGLDFRPPGGESLREVRSRLDGVLRDLAEDTRPAVLVCHKGVIHAALSLATGWDYLGRPPLRPGPDAAVAFALRFPDGRLELRGALPLRAEADGAAG